MVCGPTVDGRNPAPPKKPWNDDSLCKYQQTMVSHGSKWCEMDFVPPQYCKDFRMPHQGTQTQRTMPHARIADRSNCDLVSLQGQLALRCCLCSKQSCPHSPTVFGFLQSFLDSGGFVLVYLVLRSTGVSRLSNGQVFSIA